MKTLESLEKFMGDSKEVTVCRELTKIFEEVIAGKASEVKDYFEKNKG